VFIITESFHMQLYCRFGVSEHFPSKAIFKKAFLTKTKEVLGYN